MNGCSHLGLDWNWSWMLAAVDGVDIDRLHLDRDNLGIDNEIRQCRS